MTTLWIFGEHEPRSIEVSENVVTIGRTDNNTIRINDATISKKHARLTKNDGAWWIEDLGSVNGTWIRGERVSKLRRVDSGIRFKLGRHEFSIDEKEIVEESIAEMQNRGTIFTSIPAIPGGALAEVPTIPLDPDDPSSIIDANDQSSISDKNGVCRKETSEERKLRLIRSVGEAVIEKTELVAVAEQILSILVDEIQADRAFICTLAEDGVSDVPLASFGVEPDERIVFSKAVRREMLNNRAGVLIRQVDDDSINASLAQLDVVSTICVPLWTKDRIMGFMSMDITKSKRRAFGKRDLELLISVSHQAAIGLERARLNEIALQERKRRDYLCQYLDHKIIQSVLEAAEEDDPLAPREQTITVMFCDIVSFTKLSENLPPSELASLIHDHFTAMTEILFAHNGTVDKYIGDAVMALFGAPVADPMAAEFAVQAAIAMRTHVAKSSNLRLRMGIATGHAIVGNIGSSQRKEYTAIGDTVNVASRLESFARPDEIIVDEQTASCLQEEDYFLRSLGDIDVRNRTGAVNIFQVEPRQEV